MVSIITCSQKHLESLKLDTTDFAKTVVEEAEADLKKRYWNE